jgi:hypothetical protein
MFCPNCGSEDRQSSQYCRGCGADLRAIRQGLEKPESVMASVTSAREEIGRAIAARIREVRDASDLKILESVLPEVEKFFETPTERRLRRIRAGVVTAMCGLGGALFFMFLSEREKDLAFMIMAGVATFLIGLGIIINGLLFTVTKEHSAERSLNAAREDIERAMSLATNTREELPTARQMGTPAASVTEHTTHRLATEPAMAPKARSGLEPSE